MISTQENKKIFSKTRISLKANRLSPNSFVYPNQPASQANKYKAEKTKIHMI